MRSALSDIAAERQRQLTEEEWSAEHDDEHRDGELGRAAATYAFAGSLDDDKRKELEDPRSHIAWIARLLWPGSWDDWFKPKNRRRDLVRAGALIVAEIERLDRAEAAARKAA